MRGRLIRLWRRGRWRARTDDDFAAEIDAHVAIETDRLIASGLPPDEARHAAHRAFGNLAAARERFYESRRTLWIDELRQDVRYVWRSLRRSPGFAGVAILTLTLGIGANTTIFSVVNAVLLRPLPYSQPDSLVVIEPSEVGRSPDWALRAWRAGAGTLEGVAGFADPGAATLVADTGPTEVRAADVTWDFLSVLGAVPAAGRGFVEADAQPGAPAVVLISDDMWRRTFGADPGVVGRTARLSGTAVNIVGVMPPGFRFPVAPALTAVGLTPDLQPDVLRVAPGTRSLNALARLTAGATPEGAAAELLDIYRRAGADEFSPPFLARARISVTGLQDRLVGDVRFRLWLVAGAVAFVLLVACSNVANLLLARASVRRRELALRAALGARRWRLARLLLTESLVLALAGSVGALLFAVSTVGIAGALLADRISYVGTIPIDWTVLTVNIALAAVTGMLCGLASLLAARRADVVTALHDGGTQGVSRRSGMQRAVLTAETAITLALVVGAALFARTLWNLHTRDNGFDAARLLTVRVNPGAPPDVEPQDVRARSRYWTQFFTDLKTRLEQLPGVESAGAVSLGPLEGLASGFVGVRVDGRAANDDAFIPVAFVTPGYFETLSVALRAGRAFGDDDRAGAETVAIVNETFQRLFTPAGPTVGRRITTGSGPESFTIVGVVEDVPDRSLRHGPEPLIIAPLAQMPDLHLTWQALTFVLRTAEENPMRLAPAVRQAIWTINPDIVISNVATMDARVASGMRAERDSAALFGLFALAATIMAAIGVYGVAAYATLQRRKEIGIRVALGAERRDVSRLVVAQTLAPTLLGIAIGTGIAALATRLVTSMVYGIAPLDPAAFAGAIVLIAAVALAATWLPAHRATRLEPLAVLRE